jgi:thioredoxin-like negative regulator of GroEL
VLAVAAATQVAAAADRFTPKDPGFVVAEVRQTAPDAPLAKLLSNWRAHPGQEAHAVPLAAALIDRARRRREPRFMSRAEAVLAPLVANAQGGAQARRIYAETLQFRHDFTGALQIFDELLRENSHDADTRLMRASLRLTGGDFPGARADCAWLAATGGASAPAGFACLAESLANSGELPRAQELLAALGELQPAIPAAVRAYVISASAALHERAGAFSAAVELYQQALALAPQDDSIRCALADALVARGDRAGATRLLGVAAPSLALLVRSAALAEGAEREMLMRRSTDWLNLEGERGDAGHAREAALLALAQGDAPRALAAARQNFAAQREMADVRVLARAIAATRNENALEDLRRWLLDTRYADIVTEDILALRKRS